MVRKIFTPEQIINKLKKLLPSYHLIFPFERRPAGENPKPVEETEGGEMCVKFLARGSDI